MACIAILHPGEMGAAIGRALTELGQDVCWLPAGRSAATRRRAESAGLRECADLRACDLIVSICPPTAAVETAGSIGDFAGIYLDANATSPSTAAEVSRIVRSHGAHYVDGGVIGPPPERAGTTRLYLSGERADDVAAMFGAARIEPRVLTTAAFAASSVKMAYAAWTKISAALLLAAHATAAQLDVADALAAEWTLSQPALAQRLEQARTSAVAKGWRWEDEMRQIAATFAEAGEPAKFGEAAASIFARYPRRSEN